MKRKLVKLASVFIVVAVVFCMTAFAVDTSAVGVSSKLSAEVQSKLEVLSDSEKINVYLYFKDSSEAVMATMATTHADLMLLTPQRLNQATYR